MPGLLDLPLELRNGVYELLLKEQIKPRSRGVMVVSETYVKRDLPLRCYWGLLRTCRQIHYEFKQAIQHMVASKELAYELDITFSHGRPYFSLSWTRFPALSPTINQLLINVDLRIREPFHDSIINSYVPHDHELAHLLEDSPESFAGQLFDYIAILLKSLANLLSHGDPRFGVLYAEVMTLNLRTPTETVIPICSDPHPVRFPRRICVDQAEACTLHETMKGTLRATSKGFQAFDAKECDKLFPLIQVGSLRFATRGVIWGEGHNLVLAYNDFQWLRY